LYVQQQLKQRMHFVRCNLDWELLQLGRAELPDLLAVSEALARHDG